MRKHGKKTKIDKSLEFIQREVNILQSKTKFIKITKINNKIVNDIKKINH